MSTFQWIDARSVEQAVALLSDASGGTIAKAGGMDLLDLIKEGIVTPARIVNLQRIDTLRGVQFTAATGLRLGALTTLAQIAGDASIRQHYPALAAAERIRMSSSTTCGRCCRARSATCTPSSHSATTSMSPALASIVRSPERTRSSSSASSTLITNASPTVGGHGGST